MTTTNYDPEFVQSQGFGQSPENAAPSLFLESIAIDKDCSVYGSLFVTSNAFFGANVTIQMNLNVGGSISASGPISSGGLISASGGFASGNPMRLPGASIGGALNKFTGAMDIDKSLNVAGEIVGPLMQAAEKLIIGQPPDTGSDTSGPSDVPEAEFYFNKARYTPQEIFDSRSGQYLRVLAITQNSSS
jgi:hypothetical protein